MTVKAMVLGAPGRLTNTKLPSRDAETGAWLAVEATMLSNNEVQAWNGDRPDIVYPLIPGGQVVGRIADHIDDSFDIPIGTRVVVEPLIRCGTCLACSRDLAKCTRRKPVNAYGALPVTEAPGLWGGLAERLYLDPHTSLHQVSDDNPAAVATFVHPLASSYTAMKQLAKIQPGETVLIMGPGPRGLACLIAAQAVGASWIGVSGLDVDADRLDVAKRLGANTIIDVSTEDLGMEVANALGTRPDVVVDVTSGDPEAIYSGLEVVRSGGRLVFGSMHGIRPLTQFFSDIVVSKQLTILGARGASQEGYEWACQQLETDPRLDDMVSHQFPLDESERAIQATGGMLGREELISVAVTF